MKRQAIKVAATGIAISDVWHATAFVEIVLDCGIAPGELEWQGAV